MKKEQILKKLEIRKQQILKKLEELKQRFSYENNLLIGSNQRLISILIRRINLYKDKLEWIEFDKIGVNNALDDMLESETYEAKEEQIKEDLTIINLCTGLRKKVKLIRVLKKSIEIECFNTVGKSYKEKYFNTLINPVTFYNYDKTEIIRFDK